jgi:hypothetical protein
MPDSPLVTRIFDDLTGAFDDACKRELDDEARSTLRTFIKVTVIRAVDLGADYDTHRDYLINNFKKIGAALNTGSDGQVASAVAREDLVAACERQVNEGQERLGRARERAAAQGDNGRLEALSGEGRICEGFTRDALDEPGA